MTEPIYLWGFFHSTSPDIITTYYRKQGHQVLVGAYSSFPFRGLTEIQRHLDLSKRMCLKQKVKTQKDKKRQTFAIILQH